MSLAPLGTTGRGRRGDGGCTACGMFWWYVSGSFRCGWHPLENVCSRCRRLLCVRLSLACRRIGAVPFVRASSQTVLVPFSLPGRPPRPSFQQSVSQITVVDDDCSKLFSRLHCPFLSSSISPSVCPPSSPCLNPAAVAR